MGAWSAILAKKHLGRRSVFMITSCLWITFLSINLLWTRDANYKKEGDDWQKIDGKSIDVLDVVLPVLLAVVGGCADGFWNPQQPAILTSFFADSNLLPAMAAHKAVQSAGRAIQLTLGAVLSNSPTTRAVIMLCC